MITCTLVLLISEKHWVISFVGCRALLSDAYSHALKVVLQPDDRFCFRSLIIGGRPPPSKNIFPLFLTKTTSLRLHPMFYLRKLRVPLALRGSQNPKVRRFEGPFAGARKKQLGTPSDPIVVDQMASCGSVKVPKKFTECRPTPDDAGALLFQKFRRGSGRVGGNGKRHLSNKPLFNRLG